MMPDVPVFVGFDQSYLPKHGSVPRFAYAVCLAKLRARALAGAMQSFAMTGHLKTQTGKSLGGPVLHEGYFFGLRGYGKKIIDSVFHCQRGILKGKGICLGKGSGQSDRT
jgi:hypothetical protein